MLTVWMMVAYTVCSLIGIIGCTIEAKVTVNEISKEREHEFTYKFNGTHMLLDGNLVIDGQKHPAVILYTPDEARLFRGTECLQFTADKALFGFLPPTTVGKAKIINVDQDGLPLLYEIENDGKKSRIDFGEHIQKGAWNYSPYENAPCIKEEDIVFDVK